MDLAGAFGQAGRGIGGAHLTTTTFTTRDGLNLAADVSGDGTRGSVILAHGAGQTRHAWASTAKRLAERGWRAVALDLRGHGDSDWSPDGDYRIQSYAEDLIDVAAAVGGKPDLIGASLGGMAGLVTEATLAPGTFRTLTLVDIVPKTDPDGVDRIMGFMGANMEDGFESLEAAAETIAAYLPHRPRRTDLSGLSKNLRLGQDGRYRWHWDPRFVASVRTPGQTSATEARHQDIDIPVHLIRGRMSELISLEAASEFVGGLRHGCFTDVAEAGHMVAGDRNDVFLEAVLSFLDGRRADLA